MKIKKMDNKIKYFFLLFFILFFLCMCSHGLEEKTPPSTPATLIYMIADNNLDYYAMQNIRQMERGLPDNAAPVFVFLTRRIGANPSHPYLLKITQNKEDNIIRSPIVQTYRQQNTADPAFLRQVITDVKNHSKKNNAQLRRLVLWSHGTGWLPEGAPFDEIDFNYTATTAKNRAAAFSFGLYETGYGDGTEYQKEMCIKDLARALEGERFELLIMDACFMGTIEVAYELRETSEYFIMSPAEITSGGFPYEEIMSYLVSPEIEPLAIAVKFFNNYYNLKGALQTAAVSVINTRYLEDLADAMKTVYNDYAQYRDYIPITNFLQYDRTGSNYFFDFWDFVSRVSEQTQNDYSHVRKIYNNVLPYYLRTPKIFDFLDIIGTSGLSVYIPNTHDLRDELHEYYKSLAWTRNSNAVLLFD